MQIEVPAGPVTREKESGLLGLFRRGLTYLLRKGIPAANPDYDKRIDDVRTWLLEFDDRSGYPQREIGLDDHDRVIMTMPDEANYGYGTDDQLRYADFTERFTARPFDGKTV